MKKHNTITISGWGQRVDSLASIVPDAYHLAYGDFVSKEAWLASLEKTECELLVGWSQGGQLALRAVSEGLIKPKKLVLIGVPYQFVQGSGIKCGMHQEQFIAFKYSFLGDATRALKRFSIMVSHNDLHQKEVFSALTPDYDNAQKWEYWLDELGEFSAQEIDFTMMPEKVLLVHGLDDVVVESSQTSVFMPFMPHATIELWNKCAHAPHLHDTVRLKKLIEAL